MSRLLTSLSFDARLQFRHGFYYAGGFVAVLMAFGLRQLPRDVLPEVFPPFLAFGLPITTFYFVAGLLLLEKSEGTLEALVVTPLRVHEYLVSKVTTLTLLAALENLLVLVAVYGTEVSWIPLLAGFVGLSAFYTCLGFVAVVRYDSINEFLMPSGLFMLALQLPLLDYLGIVESPAFLVWPSQAGLFVLRDAFGELAGWERAYAVLALSFWIGLAFWWARRTFHRLVVRRQGVPAR